jgi:hypothetical protein
MWSSVAAVLAFVGVGAAFMVGEDEEPLGLSPRAGRLMALSATALLVAAALALTGLASWSWTGKTAGWSGVLGTVRLLSGRRRRPDEDDGIELERPSATDYTPILHAPLERPTDVWQSLPRW